jgi:hypothetical protein
VVRVEVEDSLVVAIGGRHARTARSRGARRRNWSRRRTLNRACRSASERRPTRRATLPLPVVPRPMIASIYARSDQVSLTELQLACYW